MKKEAETTGRVYLVGAGPGDPGLLTLRGKELLAEADLVLYDGLVNPLLLRYTHGICERTARTRRGDNSIVPQDTINQRLVEEARLGKTVVRLKGGDPYIFGRGSEEAAALEQAEIPFEVIPGVTAATAAGEYAGFSYTHREISSAVAFVTGHEDPTKSESRIDYHALARFPGTLVFYMGLGQLANICSRLIEAGMSPEVPAAVVCQTSLPSQRVASGTLGNLPEVVKESGLTPPSLIVVGECVNQRDRLSWYENLPLFGLRIGVTRPEHQSARVADHVIRLGGQPIEMPTIAIRDVDGDESATLGQTLKRLNAYDWLIFTSVNGVSAFFRRLRGIGRDVRAISHMKLAAIGPATADALNDWSLQADIVPEEYRAEALAEALVPHINGSNCLWAGANRGRQVLQDTLTAAGATVDKTVVYRNEDVTELSEHSLQALREGNVDWIGLSSPSIARNFARMLTDANISPSDIPTQFASISPVTTQAAQEAGLPIAIEAKEYTWNGIIDAIANQVQQTQ